VAIIGNLTPAKDGGWAGTIRTITIHAKLRLVPNDNRDNERAPMFLAFIGQSRVGDAWEARTNTDPPKKYLQIKLDDPSWSGPISMALFPSEDGSKAQLVWSRLRFIGPRPRSLVSSDHREME
jgi:uncharacterized protein (DUF736 family)